MSADDLRHRAAVVTGGSTELGGRGAAAGTVSDAAAGPAAPGLDAVAARVPPEYRDAYLEGVARARAAREHVAA